MEIWAINGRREHENPPSGPCLHVFGGNQQSITGKDMCTLEKRCTDVEFRQSRILRPNLQRRDVSPTLLATAGVYAFLITECLNLYQDTARDIERHCGISETEAWRLGIRSAPSLISNLVSSQACSAKFGGDVLTHVPGFYSYNRSRTECNCLEWSSSCVCHLETWRLDLRPELSARGFILPVMHPRLFFESLHVFRDVRDQRGFTLQLRAERGAA